MAGADVPTPAGLRRDVPADNSGSGRWLSGSVAGFLALKGCNQDVSATQARRFVSQLIDEAESSSSV